MPRSESPVVLIVEDEPDVAETYRRWLSDYDVHLVESGRDALDALDDTIDVVLLDRMMPGMSGSEVLAEIRARGLDCRVAMVTAVDPGFDIIEMGFDEYVTKPPDRNELEETVDRLHHRGTLDDDLQEYYSLVARRAALQEEFSEAELESEPEYNELVHRIETHRADIDETREDLSNDAAFVGAVREIMDDDAHQPGDDDPLEDQED